MNIGDLLFGTVLIEILQHLLAPKLNSVFEVITLLGNDAVLVGFTAVVYWCFDKRKGRLLTYILFLGAYLNFFLKILIPWPRPPPSMRIVEKSETGYGFPSGNAQDATTFWTWVSLDFKKRFLPLIGIVVVIAVGVSRIFLGVHYPAQVIGGLLIGFALPIVCWIILRRLPLSTGRIERKPQLCFAIIGLLPLLAAVLYGAVGEINPGQIGGYLSAFILGSIVEDRYIQFATNIPLKTKVLRAIIGGAIVGALTLGLGPIIPMTSLTPAFASTFIRGLGVVVIAPAVFKTIERPRNQRNA